MAYPLGPAARHEHPRFLEVLPELVDDEKHRALGGELLKSPLDVMRFKPLCLGGGGKAGRN